MATSVNAGKVGGNPVKDKKGMAVNSKNVLRDCALKQIEENK